MTVKHQLFTSFDSAYEGVAPWDIDHPQQAFVDLVQAGKIQGTVLDVGCGTGEHALYFAQRGHDTWGVDISPLAIKKAREKALARGLNVTFQVADALALQELGKTFETVTDSGLLHNFSDEERVVFVNGLKSVLKPGGSYFLLCFSETLPHGFGPRGISQAEIYSIFQEEWRINAIEASCFELSIGEYRPSAWLASITYTG
ncbi:MAG TPA: class I SAM-dependent methyltransferase [Ktedonobacteraceae bacterium]|jgi:ubiquinone/menaquinone biosynthesis C-methylase UbiE|nr:class I SAM-dependent methyltransferase [Ktedonobacteraceae bacterium]HLI71535.1 class I SAM-dependent methyltransferase [Ktedonobacteraceae bacterium]